ncbi:hypothetical protein JCM8115_003167 [Rhodotorula mucilaginosa]
MPQSEYLAGVPHGTCRNFWPEGRCKFGTSCKHRHDRTKDDDASVNRQRQPAQPSAPKKLTDQELTAIASGGSSDAVAGRLAHFSRGHLYRYLARDGSGRFLGGTRDMCAFTQALLASTKETTSWSLEDASNVILDFKPREPGLARVAEVVAADISSQAGSSSTLLSFQRGFVPLYLTSSIVKNSVVVANVNSLFAILVRNPSWAGKTHEALRAMILRKSVSDPNAPANVSFSTNLLAIFQAVGQLLLELMRRFPDVAIAVPELPGLISGMIDLFDEYSRDVLSEAPAFRDEPLLGVDLDRRHFVLDGVKHTLRTLPKVLDRAQVRPIVDALPREVVGTDVSAGVLTALRALMQPPGELRPDGPRHDNDFADIRKIAILPTPGELTSSAAAFVPANLSAAPYHLDGMEGRLDILFRLMREDFVGPLRSAVQSLLVDFEHLGDKHNPLAALLKRGGGRYRPASSVRGGDSSDLMVYKDVQVVGIDLDRHELLLDLSLTLPFGFKSAKHIVRNLAQGNFVALLSFDTTANGKVRNVREVEIDLGIVAADLKGAGLSVSFFDGARRSVYLDAVRALAEQKNNKSNATAPSSALYLVELPGFLVSTVEPFLRALQQLSAPAIPFADILSAKPPPRGQKLRIQPPLYARNPGFEYDLSSILQGDDIQPGSLVLRPSDPESVGDAREVLAQPGNSRLDSTQAQALVDCLTREVALVEGPPGTGKSFLGVELVRVLRAADVGKILILAFTNHALDDMLKHVYEQVTKEIVRCGSRSEDETLQAVSLFNLLQVGEPRARGARSYEIGQKIKQRKDIEEDIKRLCAVAQRPTSQITWQHISDHLDEEQPQLRRAFENVPSAVLGAIDAQEDWYTVGKRAWRIQRPEGADDIFSFWRNGADFDVLHRYVELQQAEGAEMRRLQEQATAMKEESAIFTNSFAALALDDGDEPDTTNKYSQGVDLQASHEAEVAHPAEDEAQEDWSEPTTDRPIATLLAGSHIWSFSRVERRRLIEHVTAAIVANKAPDLQNLRRNLERVNAEIRALNSENKLNLLKQARVIGATTNGCANVLDLIEKVGPTIVLVEEAGECLESQIVANLVPSVQHLICIGDHLQLRPHITSYSLSIDSARGKLHRHDVSLFERLAELPIAMSILETQRRMRPEISELIRDALYPQLEDAPNVLEYPDVPGMSRNLFFVDHRLQQDGASALHSSHTNSAEARWVVDLVRHLALQGSGASICILTPYLGQLRILRSLLEAVQITTILDERDLEDLDAEEDGSDNSDGQVGSESKNILQPHAEQRSLKTQVLLRTVDRFQGEEADIIVLSLVRNAKTASESAEDGDEDQAIFSRDARASIGFLKSPNRTNVAVSRARHGLYLFGNASLLRSKASIWESIIGNLEKEGNVCPTHSGKKDQVVDFIMMTTLADFDPNDPDPLQRLITLDCGHAFTVDTLDGVFDLKRFFKDRSDQSGWGAPVDPLESTAPVACPTCKQIVSSASNVRYRRAIKFAELYHQERLRILRSQERLDVLGAAVDVALADEKITRDLEKIRSPKGPGRRPEANEVIAVRRQFMSKTAYTPGNAFVSAYDRSPHTKAYEAGVNGLYRAEKQAAAEQALPLSDEQALRLARLQLCMAPRVAESSFSLRALWLATEVRYQLCEICLKLALRFKSDGEPDEGLFAALVSLGAFVLESVKRDLRRGCDIALYDGSKRLQLEGALNELKCSLKTTQYRLRSDIASGKIERQPALTSSQAQRQQSFATFQRLKNSLLDTKESQALLSEWTKASIEPNVDRILEQWLDFEKLITGGTFYEEVSETERRMIVQATGFATTGHWYTCERGHPYVIGDCGGAMEVATCPECGARIGGTHHALDPTNRNAVDFDRLAMEGGARREYPWGVRA